MMSDILLLSVLSGAKYTLTVGIIYDNYNVKTRSRGALGQPRILVCALPRQAGGKNCSGCSRSHAKRERERAREREGEEPRAKKKLRHWRESWASHTRIFFITAEDDVDKNRDKCLPGSGTTERASVGVCKGRLAEMLRCPVT
ncbi:hypothetical protein JOB18_013163 [Solea senegalensis]|uniref:Uncharacterized protein n=1 Tax=Solea senegalensis TaxID=28829 RepID=A0AAV6SXZ6_SOLSE|nr:hypothetical protein JOB18_013163 [Solea senegalensis]